LNDFGCKSHTSGRITFQGEGQSCGYKPPAPEVLISTRPAAQPKPAPRALNRWPYDQL
jgi:hypothetical protein